MAYRKLTGQISHRNPFHGYYHTPEMYDFDIASIDKLYKGVQGWQVTEPVSNFRVTEPVSGTAGRHGLGDFSAQAIGGAVLSGAIIGLGTYGVARLLLNKPAKSSRQWGLAGAAIIAVLSVLAEPRGV